MKKKVIGVIILNFNTWSETVTCVESIIKNKNSEEIRIYIVDNCSPQKPSSEQLTYLQFQTETTIIFHDKNKGYSAGNNVGIRRALEDGCDYFLITNSDVIFIDNSIQEMKAFLESHKDVGIVGPQIFDENNNFQKIMMLKKLTATGKILNMLLKTPFAFCSRKFERSFIRKVQLNEPIKVFGVSGCCFMINRDCMEYLFPLDERTFLYEEEYIIGSRLENSQYNVFVIPNTHVIHVQGVSTGPLSQFSYDCLINSEQIYLKDYLKTNFLLRIFIKKIRQLVRIFIG